MSYLQHLIAARNSYLANLDEHRQAGRADMDAFRTEMTIRLIGETPLMGNFYVFDIAGIDDTRVCVRSAQSGDIKIGETFDTDSGSRIRLDGLCWDAMVFKTVGAPLPMDRIAAWFERWIGDASGQGVVPTSLLDIHGYLTRHHEATGLRAHLPRFARRMFGRGVEVGESEGGAGHRGIIHGVVMRGEGEITVDFGTASVRAFDELITILDQSEAHEIVVKPERGSRDPYQMVLEMLQDQHERENGIDPASAADAFFEWFAGYGARLADRMEKMRTLEIDENRDWLDRVSAVHDEMLLEILPRIEAVHEGLMVNIGPGEDRPNALIIGAGGDPGLMQTVRELVARAPDVPDWEIIAFRPAAPVSFSLCVDLPDRGPFTIDPDEIVVSLRPRLARIDVVLHLKDADPATCLVLQQTAEHAVELVVGELAYLEGVGRVSVEPFPDDPNGTGPLNDMAGAFARVAAEMRRVLETLNSASDDQRVERNLSLLDGQIAAFEAVLDELGKIEPVPLRLDFWSPEANTAELVDDALPDFQIAEQQAGSVAGAGWTTITTGTCPVAPGAVRGWLAATLAPVITGGAFLVGVAELELYIEGMVAELDQRASELLEADRWAEAAQIMRPLTARFGDVEDGRMHTKTGLCYMRGGHYALALKYYDQALERLIETDWTGETHNNAGICHQHLGRMDAAISHYRQALDLDPDSAARQYNLGQGYALIGDAQNACIHLRRAAELDDKHARMVIDDPDLNTIRTSAPFVALVNELAA